MSDSNLEGFYSAVDALVDYAHAHLYLNPADGDWARNQIFALFQLNSYRPTGARGAHYERPDELLLQIRQTGSAATLFEPEMGEYYSDQIIGILSLPPSQLAQHFSEDLRENDPTHAMNSLYDYAIKNNYVRRSTLDKNPRFTTNGLIVTINKAKPEFKNPSSAQAGNSVAGGYPQCSICHENENFAGRTKFTLRTVPLTLDGQPWFWQFSPYGYLYQHGIAVNCEHIPMHIDRGTFRRLMDFVDQFPSLFIGSNAPLPRIGGSVLGHDHYQAGGEKLPMHQAGAALTLASSEFPQATVEILDWHNTVVRIVSTERDEIEEISARINEAWLSYRNDELGIIPRDGDEVFSAISPTVFRSERGYEMSIILRSNITSEEYPEGVFHAHPEYFAVKQESIGLIEAQGLFVLPGRLDDQLQQIAQFVADDAELPAEFDGFAAIVEQVRARIGSDRQLSTINEAIRVELGIVCQHILENTAVFKDHKLTQQFLADLGFLPVDARQSKNNEE